MRLAVDFRETQDVLRCYTYFCLYVPWKKTHQLALTMDWSLPLHNVLVIICSLHASVVNLFDFGKHQPDTAVRFNLMLYRPFPNAENVTVERQRDSRVFHVARDAH